LQSCQLRELTDVNTRSSKTWLGVHTIPSYVLFCVPLRDIASPLSDDETKLDWQKLRRAARPEASRAHTFMVSGYPSWDLDYTARREVTGRGLEEEEWLLWKRVFEFLDMVRVVTPYCNNLSLFDI